MEKGVGGALQPVSIDEDQRIVSTEEVLRYFHSQVSWRCTLVLTPILSWEQRPLHAFWIWIGGQIAPRRSADLLLLLGRICQKFWVLRFWN